MGTRAPIPHLPDRRDAEEAAGRGGGDLLLLFLMLLLMAKKATWSFLPFARRDPPPLPASFRTCLLHPQQEADLVVFLETEGISSLFSSPPCCFCFILSHFLVKRGGKKKRKERNPTRPWGFSSQHPRHPLPLKKTEGSGRGIGPTADILGGRAGSSARTETPRWRIPVLLGFSSFFPFFFLFLPSFFSFFPSPPPQPEEKRRARRGARGGARGGPRRNWDGFARSGAGGASWRPPHPAPPKSVR